MARDRGGRGDCPQRESTCTKMGNAGGGQFREGLCLLGWEIQAWRQTHCPISPLARLSSSVSTWPREGGTRDSAGGHCPASLQASSQAWGTLAASLPLRFPWEVTFERLHGSPSLGNSSFGYLRES